MATLHIVKGKHSLFANFVGGDSSYALSTLHSTTVVHTLSVVEASLDDSYSSGLETCEALYWHRVRRLHTRSLVAVKSTNSNSVEGKSHFVSNVHSRSDVAVGSREIQVTPITHSVNGVQVRSEFAVGLADSHSSSLQMRSLLQIRSDTTVGCFSSYSRSLHPVTRLHFALLFEG